jgi:hypothetical protein
MITILGKLGFKCPKTGCAVCHIIQVAQYLQEFGIINGIIISYIICFKVHMYPNVTREVIRYENFVVIIPV